MPTLLSSTVRRRVKPGLICDCCAQPILPGECYVDDRIVDDYVYRWASHDYCHDWMDAYYRARPYDELGQYELITALEELFR